MKGTIRYCDNDDEIKRLVGVTGTNWKVSRVNVVRYGHCGDREVTAGTVRL